MNAVLTTRTESGEAERRKRKKSQSTSIKIEWLWCRFGWRFGHIPWCHSFLPRTTRKSVSARVCVCVCECVTCAKQNINYNYSANMKTSWRYNWFGGWSSVDCPRQNQVKINDDKRITAVSISVRLCERDEEHFCTCSSDSCAARDGFLPLPLSIRTFLWFIFDFCVYVTFERFCQTFHISWSHISFVWFRWRATPFASEHTFPCALSRTNTLTQTMTETETEALKQTSSNESIKRGRYFAAARQRCESCTFYIINMHEKHRFFSFHSGKKPKYNRNNRRIVCVNPSQLSDRFFIIKTFILKNMAK